MILAYPFLQVNYSKTSWWQTEQNGGIIILKYDFMTVILILHWMGKLFTPGSTWIIK